MKVRTGVTFTWVATITSKVLGWPQGVTYKWVITIKGVLLSSAYDMLPKPKVVPHCVISAIYQAVLHIID